MPVQIVQDTNLPRVIASGTDPDGVEYRETESVVYAAGQVVYEDDLTDEVLEALEDGDESLSQVAKVISEEEADRILAEQAGVQQAVVPEHEAEAEVFAQDGKDVVTREEQVALNPNGDVVADEVEVPDLSEGREAEDADSIRSKEVDAKRRGDSPAPDALPAAEEGASPSEPVEAEPTTEPVQTEPAKSEPAKSESKSEGSSKSSAKSAAKDK
jgi:hypothetical protein